MRYMLLAVILVVVLIVVYRSLSSAGAAPRGLGETIRVSDIPDVFGRVRDAGRTGVFAAFILADPERFGDEALNVQFSVEDSSIGFDWVLLAELNLKDKERFAELAQSRGYTVQRKNMNDVSYLRVESGDLPALATAVFTDLYGLSIDHELGIVAEGITWP